LAGAGTDGLIRLWDMTTDEKLALNTPAFGPGKPAVLGALVCAGKRWLLAGDDRASFTAGTAPAGATARSRRARCHR
jgi:hypothetical protein